MSMAALHKLAVILENPQNDAEFLLVKQTRPPKFDDDEYDSYVDSDLWDLPSAQLKLREEAQSESSVFAVEVTKPWSEKIQLTKFDLDSALIQVLGQVGLNRDDAGGWRLCKYVEEARFGPGPPINSVFLRAKSVPAYPRLPDTCKWMSVESCLRSLVDVRPSSERVGPLAVAGLVNETRELDIPTSLTYQEYPPGVVLVPMGSWTAKPFTTTNMVVFAPRHVSNVEDGTNGFIACGDALIVDPGCLSEFHEELAKVVAALPRKLIVFVTHHHADHVDGLSVIQRCNPDAKLLAHENTMSRIGTDDWSLGFTAISGNEEISIGGQRFTAIFSPGHTDGHMGLLHASTHSLIVGDHCAGQGSTILDIASGGNMSDYFQSTYKFMEMSPHALIPMHGRINLWPKHMLSGYLKNRRSRENVILKSIENGAETMFDILADVYPKVDRNYILPAASNVKLHVDHLAQKDKLPKGFSLDKFCGSSLAFYHQNMGKL